MKKTKMVAARVLTLAKEDFKEKKMWEYVCFSLGVDEGAKSSILDISLYYYKLIGRIPEIKK